MYHRLTVEVQVYTCTCTTNIYRNSTFSTAQGAQKAMTLHVTNSLSVVQELSIV